MHKKHFDKLEGILFFCIIFLDQAVKYVVKSGMILGESIPLVPHIFHLTYVLNPGAAFGVLENQRIFFVLMGVVLLFCIWKYYPKIRRMDTILHYGCVALAAGAVGNLIDRIQNGLVVDFLDFRIWPVFNIADIAIVVGVLCMIYAMLFRMEEEEF